MGKIIIKNDEVGYEKLEEVLASYQGFHRIYLRKQPKEIAFLLYALEEDIVELFLEDYSHRGEEVYDKVIEERYISLVQQSRWKKRSPEMSCIRLNALSVTKELGVPIYRDFIYYSDSKIAVHCGNLWPHNLFMALSYNQEMNELYIFPYPSSAEISRQYYRLVFSDKAKIFAKNYYEIFTQEMLGTMRKVSESKDKPISEV